MAALPPPPHAAATTCQGLSTTTQTLTSTLVGMLGPEGDVEDAVRVKIAAFLSRLRELRQHTDQLGSCFADAHVVHTELGDVLQSAVSQCHDSIVGFQVKISPAHAVDLFTRYEALAATHIRLFILGTQMLIMGSALDQQSTMASPAARAIIDAALAASRAVVSA